jgi:serine/threonine protein kinase
VIYSTLAGADAPGVSEFEFAALIERLTAKIQDGESVALEQILREFPQHEERLRQLFPAIRALADMGSSSRRDARPAGQSDFAHPVRGLLGDFQIVREVGRGGMGVVYEATQISLGRRVALKVLPLVGVLDHRQLQRFKTEAQAAASLHHPNIVPVHGIGCDRGVHYYAMQFIEGRTLADVLREMSCDGRRDDQGKTDVARARAGTKRVVQASLATERSTQNASYIRSIAELGVQVADALEHAHHEGVVHRDIKPSNLILADSSKVWVTDFGLARIEADAGLTMTGDIVGTLRYMSPEQALAQRVSVDERTDIYSLCATLYELLTLQPVFGGADRRELLRQIAFQEPRPLRQLNRAVPGELGTIVLKGLEKNPDHRYRSARELADDLRRFLENRPIHARPPSLVQKAIKWTSRHKPLVWSAAASTALLLVVTIVGLAMSNAMIARERKEKSDALIERTTALGEKEAALAVADANLQNALEVVDRMLTRVAEKDLPSVPEVEPVRRALLEDALEFCLRFLQQERSDPLLLTTAAQALKRISYIYGSHRLFGDALRATHAAHGMLEKLVDDDPSNGALRGELANIAFRVGNLYCRTLDDFTKAEPFLRQCASLHRDLSERWPHQPTYRLESLHFAIDLAYVLSRTGREVEAVQVLREYVAETRRLATDFPEEKKFRGTLAVLLSFMALHVESTDLAAAEAAYRESIAVGRAVAEGWELGNLLHTQCNLAMLLKRTGRVSELEDLYVDAAAGADRIVVEHWQFFMLPAIARARRDLGFFLESQSRHVEAEQVFRRTWRDLQFPASHGYCEGRLFVDVSQDLVRTLERTDRTDEIEHVLRTTAAAMEKLDAEYPISAEQPTWWQLVESNRVNWLGSSAPDSEGLETASSAHRERRLEEAQVALDLARINLARFLAKSTATFDLNQITSDPSTAQGFFERGKLFEEFGEPEKAVKD